MFEYTLSLYNVIHYGNIEPKTVVSIQNCMLNDPCKGATSARCSHSYKKFCHTGYIIIPWNDGGGDDDADDINILWSLHAHFSTT